MLTPKRLATCAGLLTVALGIWRSQAAGYVAIGEDFGPNEVVSHIRLELTVADGGEDLDEPIALDLGLGFPLWLQRLGRVEVAEAPFGAVSQVGTETHAIPAGSTGSFEFAISGAPGLDDLRTTGQLLENVHVSDISRIAFASRADHGWIIAGYKIEINGKLFVANDSVNANGRGLQDATRERLTALNREFVPQQEELIDLQSLAIAGLATDEDQTRLNELHESLAPQIAEQRMLERQLVGAAPFYSEAGFRPIGRNGTPVGRMTLTVVTAPHHAAATDNYVYFRTGGHKYLLSSPAAPLTPDFGPKVFELDLTAAPLTASDLRGYALGMIAHRRPYADAPDRWHPERLRVEVDDRVVYDSEDNAIDRSSLSAIRLIPPAHVNSAGVVVEDHPIARETFVWEAGGGMGLDLVNGGAEELPLEGEDDYPDAEPVVVVDQDVTIVEEDADSWYDPECDPFPGETGYGPGWEPGWWPGSPWNGGWGPEWQGGWGFGWFDGPSWFDLLMYGLLDELGILPDWVIPDPVGAPPQLEEVDIRFTAADYRIEWSVEGDASQIDHFLVEAVQIRPDHAVPYGSTLGGPVVVAAHERSVSMMDVIPGPMAMSADERSRSFFAFKVTMIPTDPSVGVDPGFSPALPCTVQYDLELVDTYQYEIGGATDVRPLSLTGEPEIPIPAAWAMGRTETHNGLVFSSIWQYHVAARAMSDLEHLSVRFGRALQPGRYRLIAYVGFHGLPEHATSVDVTGNCLMYDPANPGSSIGYPAWVHLDVDPAGPPAPLTPIIFDIDTSHVGAGVANIVVTYRFGYANVDPEHPPMLVGLRMVDAP